MARARNIKPGFYENEELAACSIEARYLFPALWQLADREGRLEDRPLRIKGYAFRYDGVDVGPLLDELQQRGFIARYEVDGLHVIQVTAFAKHQNPHHREAPSTLPSMPGQAPEKASEDAKPGALTVCHGTEALGQPEADPGPARGSDGMQGGVSRADSGFLNPDSGFLNPESPLTPQRGGEGSSDRRQVPGAQDPLFVEFYAAYPRKTGRAEAWKAWHALKVTPALHANILAGLAKWKAHPRWKKDGGQFIKHPGPWLRARLWEDDEVCGGVIGQAAVAWWVPAGFANVHEAGNAGCYEHTAGQFRDGKRLEVA
jgi:hypothetical protein